MIETPEILTSYHPESEAGGLKSELTRLEAQVQLSWSEEARLLDSIGLRDGMSVLEIGCGPGGFSERLLKHLPTSKLTAIELRPDLLALAKKRVFSARAEFHVASVLNSGLAENLFDFAIARLVFQHLDAPVAAASAIRRLLKPGGKLAIIDVDAELWGIVQPRLSVLETVYQKAGQLQFRRGGDRVIGRRLWKLLQAAEFQRPRLDSFVYHSDELGISAFDSQLNPDRLLPAVESGVITIEDYAIATIAYKEFLASPDPYILMVGLLAHGVK